MQQPEEFCTFAPNTVIHTSTNSCVTRSTFLPTPAWQVPGPTPRWFTPLRLLGIFCTTNLFVYLDRGMGWLWKV